VAGGAAWGPVTPNVRVLTRQQNNRHPISYMKRFGLRGLNSLDDAKVAFVSGAKRLERFSVGLTFISREGGLIAGKFDQNRPLLQSGLVRLNPAGGAG
jgi:hypothetical protein